MNDPIADDLRGNRTLSVQKSTRRLASGLALATALAAVATPVATGTAAAAGQCPIPGMLNQFFTITPATDGNSLLKRPATGIFPVISGSRLDGVSWAEKWRFQAVRDDLGQPICEGSAPVVYLENTEVKVNAGDIYHVLDTENNGQFVNYHQAPGTVTPWDKSSSQHWVMSPYNTTGGYTFKNRSGFMPEGAKFLSYDPAAGNLPFVMGGGSPFFNVQPAP